MLRNQPSPSSPVPVRKLMQKLSTKQVNRKICIVTGTRAEYGLLKPVMAAVRDHPNLALAVCAAGMHLDREFGHTIDEIKKDGFPVACAVRMSPDKDTSDAMAAAVGRGIISFTAAFSSIKPDIVVVLGDRIEALAATIAAAYTTIPIAHIHGGDRSRGGIDESARHAITKLAHIHFAATKKSAERLRKMGEDSWRIHTVGAPGLDTILHVPRREEKAMLANYHLAKPYLLVVQHSVTTQVEDAARQMRETLTAVTRLGHPAVVVYPNSDAGGRSIIEEIQKTVSSNPRVKAFPSLPHADYLGLLKHAAVLLGNSSSGMIESASFKIPVVNIGTRQDGRERSTNVIDVKHDAAAIVRAVRRAMSPAFARVVAKAKNPYGDGTAGKKIAGVLARVKLDKKLIQKQLAY